MEEPTMPRTGRIVLPGYPHHIVQRGHNRQVVFAGEADYRRYLGHLHELSATHEVRVHAYCLMTNHVHLLLTPGDVAGALARLMKALAARTTRYRNRLERRTGTLWESRYKSSPIQSDRYLLACVRYIELNPVRAGMVPEAADYPWSSYRPRMGLDANAWFHPDPGYLGLGDSEPVRRSAYKRFLREVVPPGEWALIRESLQRGQLTGNQRFVDEVARIAGRRVEFRRPGRPSLSRDPKGRSGK
jgi:putative transposase